MFSIYKLLFALCLSFSLLVLLSSVLPRHVEHRKHHLPHNSHVWNRKAEQVKQAFIHSYNGYKKYAMDYDELLPVNGGHVNNFNGWRVTLVDSLDTMWLMGLHKEFYDAIPLVANETFYLDDNSYAPFFETVIRYLGGLLSAYALSGEDILLLRANELGKALLPALDTPSGLPKYAINTVNGRTREGWLGPTVLYAEALSCQLEYKYLAHLTGHTQYYHKVEHIMDVMRAANISDGVYPTMWNPDGTPANNRFSVGAFADSAHEYLLKQYLLTGRSEPKALEMYLQTATAIIDNLLYLTPKRRLLYVTSTSFTSSTHTPTYTFEHLSCFLPGLLALGARTLPPTLLPAREKERHMWAAQGLALACWARYADQASGLGPDEVAMEGGESWVSALEKWELGGREGGVPPGLGVPVPTRSAREYRPRKSSYLLRPETIESFFVLWRTTGDEAWRERGWVVFQAIERAARTPSGYASVSDVDFGRQGGGWKDEMPSYFMAETLKYLYLLFSDPELASLDHFVFNTEAHPLPIFEWRTWEKKAYGIT